MTTVAEIERRVRAQFRPPPRLSLADWADAKFELPLGDANAGRWHTLPYQRAILDAISDPDIERVTVMKSSRVGYTKAFCAAVGYHIEHDPCPILIVQPTLDDAKKHSKEDIAPMLRDCRALEGLVSEAKTRDSDNTILEKLFRGGSLSLIGANSPRGFRRTSRRVVIFDEVDGYPQSAGTEGDQIELGTRRTEYYWNRKIIAGSTPTLAGLSRIERLFLEGDQRRRYVPCPHCGEFQTIRFPNLKWPEGRPYEAILLCEANGCTIEHKHKRAMDEAGEWRAEAPENFLPLGADRGRASFHIWAGYSYSPNATWGQLAAEFLKADRGGATTLQTFVNTVLGETWHDRGEAPAWDRLMRRRELYPIGTVPQGGLFLTCGVDVQRDRLCYEVVGWGRGKCSWSVDYGVLPGDTADMDHGPWGQLDALLARPFTHAAGVEMTIRLMAVDSGYNTQTVYGWCRRFPQNRVIAIKGQQSGGALIGAPSAVEYNDRGRQMRHGYKVWPVVGAMAKSELYGWLRLELPTDGSAAPPGYCHFPEYGEDYFRELTAEQLVPVKTRRGFVKMEWALIPGRRNEVLDARVYARAAAAVIGLDRAKERDWLELERTLGPVSEAPPPVAEERTPEPRWTQPVEPMRAQPRPQWLAPRRGWLKNDYHAGG